VHQGDRIATEVRFAISHFQGLYVIDCLPFCYEDRQTSNLIIAGVRAVHGSEYLALGVRLAAAEQGRQGRGRGAAG